METTRKKQAHYVKLLNQDKILKLINRIYMGDRLNLKQITQIMNFVNDNGFRTEKQYYFPPTDFLPSRTVKYQGMEYAGMFIYQDTLCTNIDYYSHKENKKKTIKIYGDGKILVIIYLLTVTYKV